jgi:hypothetical protein
MLRLDLDPEPAWLDLGHGVRVRVLPCTTSIMASARSDPLVESVGEDAPRDELALAMAKAVARRVVLEWEGVGDAAGNPVPVSPEGVDALMEVFPIFEAFQLVYLGKALMLEQEKNVSAPSPTGTSAGARATARPASARARTARPA